MESAQTFLDVQCPYCGDTASFPEDMDLKLQECANCMESIIIPDGPSPVAEKVPLPIQTDRLILRRLERGDWKDLLECFGDERLFEYVIGGPVTQEQVTEWTEKDSYTKLTSANTWFCLAMQNRQTDKVIGEVQWSLAEDHSQATFDLYVNHSFQRQGFGIESLTAALRFCFLVLGFRRAVLSCDTRNTGAWRMAEKTGMRREGEFLKDRFLNGQWASTFQYAMLAKEFPDKK
jgi:ribosomal-protein-alanine N-acetyltransferase